MKNPEVNIMLGTRLSRRISVVLLKYWSPAQELSGVVHVDRVTTSAEGTEKSLGYVHFEIVQLITTGSVYQVVSRPETISLQGIKDTT